jgi:uncharacterized membrane protein
MTRTALTLQAANALDAAATLYGVRSGMMIEANPLMRSVIEAHPGAFVLAKLALVGLAGLLLWRLRAHRNARTAARVAAAIQATVAASHLGWLAG